MLRHWKSFKVLGILRGKVMVAVMVEARSLQQMEEKVVHQSTLLDQC